MNKKEKTVRNSEYYEKRASEEWSKMFEYAEERERWATYIECQDECIYYTQKSKQAARRAVLYEIEAKNMKPGFSARRVKLQFDLNHLPFNIDFDDDYVPLRE
ncbi:MAG: hypothetical protein WCT49_05865 [Candidatus Paceibacterota bacterium]|jgi:hypothetical protein|nr:hypothetical protein [Candidatus Paceibacterota bacterium]